ncbi:MAG: aminodeoxychorismate lyase [Blastococcus sp.]|nr:aminodeoxychorismate lyase [Blastococcus sp.]
MTEPGGPRQRGRHSSAADGPAGVPAPGRPAHDDRYGSPANRYGVPGNRHGVPEQAGRYATDRARTGGYTTGGFRSGEPPAGAAEATSRKPGYVASAPGRATGAFARVSGVLDRFPDQTGPIAEPAWWSYGSSDHPDHPLSARHSEDRPRPGSREPHSSDDLPGSAPREQYHPSAPLPPLPSGVWDRLRPRDRADGHDGGHADGHDDGYDDGHDDAPTVAHRFGRPADEPADDRTQAPKAPGATGPFPEDDDHTDAHHMDPHVWEDQTGGLEVIGAHVEDGGSRGRWWRRGRRETHLDEDAHGDLHDEDIPVAPYNASRARGRGDRRPWAVLLSLLVLAGLVVGIVVGGEKLLTMINPSSRDFTGQGSGTVEVRISQGDTLSDIARTLVDEGVVASVGPFVDAAEADPAATGIQPGVYRMREQMSGESAVDLLLDPAARLVTRVMLPEGLTVKATLAKLAETSGTPVAEFEKAAADPVALGLPAYAGGKLEGFLFPATYDFEPDTTPAQMLTQMIERAVHAFDDLQIPPAERLAVVTKASLVQAEASSTEDMAKVARVLENRLADGMALQLDTTVNYANGKAGITTTSADRANPSPYNTYLHPGLPPGAIDNPGEEALRAVLSPAAGDWRFFVVVNPDTGETRFAATGAEHQQNVLLFQQWLREHPGG